MGIAHHSVFAVRSFPENKSFVCTWTIMKMLPLLTLFCGAFLQVYSETCTVCESNYGDTNNCNDIATYIKCLTTAAGDGCDTIHTKMSTANQEATDNSCTLTDTCKCQVNYLQTDFTSSDANKCRERVKELDCLLYNAGAGCDATQSLIDTIKASENAAKALPECTLTDTCQCLVNFAKSEDNACTAVKKEIKCMFTATENACATSITAGIQYSVIMGTVSLIPDCFAGSTCECEAILAEQTTIDCTTSTAKINCLLASTLKGKSCDDTQTWLDVLTEIETSTKAIESCTLTDTCQCQVNYGKSQDNACTVLKKELKCMFAATGNACDGSSTVDATYGIVKEAAANINDCFTGTTCACEATLAEQTTIDCTKSTAKLNCLLASTLKGKSCDDSQTWLDVLTEIETSTTAIESCTLTDTCQCQVNYVKSEDNACTAVKKELKCMFAATGNACDGSSTVDATYGIVKEAAANINDCFTGTACACEVALEKGSKDCTAYKDGLKCLFASHVTNNTTKLCDGGSVAEYVKATKQTALTINDCLTSTCLCQASYYSRDLSTNALKCMAAAEAMACTSLITISEASCDGTTNKTDVDTFMDGVRTAAMCGSDGTSVMYFPTILALVVLMSWTVK